MRRTYGIWQLWPACVRLRGPQLPGSHMTMHPPGRFKRCRLGRRRGAPAKTGICWQTCSPRVPALASKRMCDPLYFSV